MQCKRTHKLDKNEHRLDTLHASVKHGVSERQTPCNARVLAWNIAKLTAQLVVVNVVAVPIAYGNGHAKRGSERTETPRLSNQKKRGTTVRNALHFYAPVCPEI